MTAMENLIEANRDNLEKAYYTLSKICIREDGILNQDSEKWQTLRALETALVNLGILEPDEEPEEEEEELDYTNDKQHWDEWVADQRYDMYRDLALMGYEY